MPRYPNFPTTTDETQRLELSYLLRSGLLQPGYRNRNLTWSRNGKQTAAIGIATNIDADTGSWLRLYYTVNDKTEYDYTVDLVQVASNLPGCSGGRWYMVCPVSGRRATVLYMRTGTGKFAHREAYGPTRLYYDSQLEPKRFRGIGKYYSVDREWEREYRKGRKTHYRGKPTRWYARLLNLEATTADSIPMLLRQLNAL